MTFEVQPCGADDATDAALWVVRLAAGSAELAEFERFEHWLAGSPARGATYDRALAAWTRIQPRTAAAAPLRLGATARRARWSPATLALAAGTAAAASVTWVFLPPIAPPQSFATGVGERRRVALDDGSRLTLNANTHLVVRFSRAAREVSLGNGEAAFDVARDPRRPFLVRVGSRSVRVVGTEFDVKAQGEALTVAVRRGLVQVRASDRDAPLSLVKGDQLTFAREGTAPERRRIEPDDAFAWRDDRLVYRGTTLRRVVAALNARFGPPALQIDDDAAQLPFSGVLMLDSREATVRRLTLAAPLSAQATPSGIRLRMDQKPPQ